MATPAEPLSLPEATGAFASQDPRVQALTEEFVGEGLPSAREPEGPVPAPPQLPAESPEMTPEEAASFIEAQGPEYQIAQEAEARAAERQFAQEQALGNILRDRRAARENQERYERMARAAEAEVGDILQRSQALSDKRVDTSRWWSDLTSGQRANFYVAAFIDGLLSPGQPSQAVALVKERIDKDIELQKWNLSREQGLLEQQQGLVAQQYAITGDLYKAAEIARGAMYASVDAELGVRQQMLDPSGTQAREILAMRQQWRADMETQRRELEDREFNKAHKLEEQAIKREGIEQRREASRRQAWVAKRGQDIELAKFRASEVRAAREEAGKIDFRSVGNLKQADGSPFIVADPKMAEELSGRKTQYELAHNLISRMIMNRERHGWKTNTMRSAAWQRMESDKSNLAIIDARLKELGVLAGPDLDMVFAGTGVGDVTGWRDPLPGMENYQKFINEAWETELRNRKYTGPPVKFQDPKDVQEYKEQVRVDARKKALKSAKSTFESKYGIGYDDAVKDYDEVINTMVSDGTIPLEIVETGREAHRRLGDATILTENMVVGSLASDRGPFQPTDIYGSPESALSQIGRRRGWGEPGPIGSALGRGTASRVQKWFEYQRED
jgi:hypothetical protein